MSKIHQVGWTVAAAFAAVLFASGFQVTPEKIGVVNVSKLVTTSDFGKASQANIDKLSSARKEMLSFAAENAVMSLDQAQQYKELSLKNPRNTGDEAKLAQIKDDAKTNTKKLIDLAGKTTPTADEKALMTDFNNRSLQTRRLAQEWAQDFQQEVQQYGESQYNSTMEHVQAAMQEAAKAQGFTTVFDSRYAPYGASDLTDAALTAMNAKK